MERRRFIEVIAGGLLASPLAAEAQQAGKVVRIGVLGDTSPPVESSYSGIAAFRQELRDLGYVEGPHVTIEYRWAEGQRERLPDLAADLVRSKVDVILALGPASARAAKNATTTIPVVFVGSGDPIAEGLVSSLARPGGNVTGLAVIAGLDIVGKRLALLKEVVPGVTRMAMLWNPTNPSHVPALKKAPGIAQSLRVELEAVAARGPEEFDGAFATMREGRVGGLLVLADGVFVLQAARLVNLSAESHLPTIYGNRTFTEAGGLMSYQGSFVTLYRRAASIVDKILKGAKPADLPVEQPTQIELVINLKTAKALGLTIPPSLLGRADEVIQ
jgi:putative tryptophan/tyrosine transport system substrate-binding protein